MASNKVMVSFRLPVSTIEHLEKLCSLSKSSKGCLVAELIDSQYDKIEGNPQLKLLLDKLKDIQETIDSINA